MSTAHSSGANNDSPERDPRLAKLYAASNAGGADELPAALDAAILAAARREVRAGPQPVSREGGGKRNWYVPMSIAAVLVLSVSLVTLTRQEKGDDLYQPAQTPAAAAPAAELEKRGAPDEAKIADAAGAKVPPPVAVAQREADTANTANTARSDMAKARSAAQDADASRETAARGTVDLRGNAPSTGSNDRAKKVDAPAAATTTAVPPTATTPAPVAAVAPPPAKAAVPMAARPEPLPGSSEREAASGAMRDAPAQQTTPLRREADVAAVRESPALSIEDGPARTTRQRAPQPAEAAGAPRAPAAPAVAARPMAKPALAESPSRPVWLAELDIQPPEKWLARLAEFKRDGRSTDAATLLAEFRRRFPDHPASR